MTRVIRLTTSKFDVSAERPNPINPIAGESLLLWLREQLSGMFAVSAPEAEDWGWYSFIEYNGRQYLLGASASEENLEEREWILQIEKHRSFSEKIFRRAAMTEDDQCASFIHALLESEPSFNDVSVDP
jgi:hypothetical protein